MCSTTTILAPMPSLERANLKLPTLWRGSLYDVAIGLGQYCAGKRDKQTCQ